MMFPCGPFREVSRAEANPMDVPQVSGYWWPWE